MAIHISPLTSGKIALAVRIYSGVPDDAPAYHHRIVLHSGGQVVLLKVGTNTTGTNRGNNYR